MFGKFFNNERQGGDLRLSDYKNIWSRFCFLDESGSLNNPTESFFLQWDSSSVRSRIISKVKSHTNEASVNSTTN